VYLWNFSFESKEKKKGLGLKFNCIKCEICGYLWILGLIKGTSLSLYIYMVAKKKYMDLA
jgi:hypothetical protein